MSTLWRFDDRRGSIARETDISAECAPTEENPWVPRADEDQGRAEGVETPAGQGAQTADRLTGRFPRHERLTTGSDFQALFQRGKRVDRPSMTILWCESVDARRVGFAVSRQVRRAVAKNRVRRRLREAYRAREKRALIAAVLRAALLVVYQLFFSPTPQEAPAPRPAAQTATPATPPLAPPTPATPAAPRPPAPRPLQRLATVETPRYNAVVSSEGGKLQEFDLKYRGDKPMVIVGDLGPAGLLIAADANRSPDVVPMTLSSERITVGAERSTEDLVLTGEHDGLRVRERLTFHADDFAVDVSLRVENATRAPRTVTLT